MNRREFIKLGGLTSLSLFLNFKPLEKLAALPVEIAAQGKVYRGTSDGKIFISEDGGKTWRLHTNLGSMCSIQKFFIDSGNQLKAQVGYQNHSFQLALHKNGKLWNSSNFKVV